MTAHADRASPEAARGPSGVQAWVDALMALTLFAIDPIGTVGIRVRGHAGPVRSRWLELLATLIPPGTPIRKLPCSVADAALIGGLDLAATLRAGRPVAERGALAATDGGIVMIAMAERLSANSAALIKSTLDSGLVVTERDGLALTSTARFGLVLLDEGIDDEQPPRALTERLAFDVDLRTISLKDLGSLDDDAAAIAAARARLHLVRSDPSVIAAFCETAAALGVGSVRAELLALAVARACAALAGRPAINGDDACLAARLVFASRATQMPAPPEAEATSEQSQEADPAPADQPHDDSDTDTAPRDLGDIMRTAVSVALPPDLLARTAMLARAAPSKSEGRAGSQANAGARGRVIGTLPGRPRGGVRLNLIATLRAAAPWQTVRASADPLRPQKRIRVTLSDLRVSRHKSRQRSAIVFAVDASGSQALHRLAEAKGAVELLLADCYVRRDEVAVIAFRGHGAELILPPTHSLTRAKRALAGLPGGGGTPLAAGIDAALALALKVRRSGETPVVVILTDGQANIGRSGQGGRAQAETDALAAARSVRAAGLSAIFIDTAQRPGQRARDVADAMGAHYVALPQANAAAVSTVLKGAAAQALNE